jgi:hypothetical protein
MPPDQLVPGLTLVTKPRPLDTDEDPVKQTAWSADGQWFWTGSECVPKPPEKWVPPTNTPITAAASRRAKKVSW